MAFVSAISLRVGMCKGSVQTIGESAAWRLIQVNFVWLCKGLVVSCSLHMCMAEDYVQATRSAGFCQR